MKLTEIVEKLGLQVKTGADHLDADVTRGYASDMLSDVMGHADEGALWITLQAHQNIVAVAVMKSLAGIILVGGREPDKETTAKAESEGIPILITDRGTFGLVGQLHELGIGGA
jgi:predicted transcriptional regulator